MLYIITEYDLYTILNLILNITKDSQTSRTCNFGCNSCAVQLNVFFNFEYSCLLCRGDVDVFTKKLQFNNQGARNLRAHNSINYRKIVNFPHFKYSRLSCVLWKSFVKELQFNNQDERILRVYFWNFVHYIHNTIFTFSNISLLHQLRGCLRIKK